MRKWLVVLMLLSAGWSALEDALLAPGPVSGNPLRGLSLEAPDYSDANPAPLQYELDSLYAPGQTVTFEIKTLEPRITAAEVSVNGVRTVLREYAPGEWTGYCRLPAGLAEGVYPAEIFLRGADYEASDRAELNVSYPLAEIKIDGLKTVSENIVREELLIKPGDFYSELRAEVNRQRILNLGFFERADYTRLVRGQTSVLVYTIRENPRLNRIIFAGNEALSDAELSAALELRPGAVLAVRQMQKDLVALEKLYRDKDYVFARIDSVERPSSANNYTLTYRITEGRVGAIRILGNAVTQEKVIAREMDMRSGDIFNAAVLREDLRNIYNLNYFAALAPDIHFNEETGLIDLDIRVEEKKTSSINFGGGYGQVQGWFGFIDLMLDNVMGSGQSLLLKSQFAERITSYQIRYHNPWMWDNKTSFTGRLWSTYGYNYLSGQRELRNGWSTTVGFRRTRNIYDSFTFRYEDVFNTDDRSQDYLDRAVAYTISYDTRDQWMNPTTGLHNVFSMDHSSKLLGGSINASRYSLQFNQFFPLAEKQVLALREMYDYQLGDIFPAEQYYVGSDTTVRGYQSVFAKGNERAIFNIEYRYIFTEIFVGVLFYDIGQAIKPVADPLDEERGFANQHGWGAAQGFGLRIITPMGPIRLDYGWPQYREFADGFLSFNIGNTF
ncbi:MAG: BamA/TamA family outer membrane protein [Candidatus Margulisbacteria bacterium]|jgi:outer membrane protein insertion porin family|nr:BamA/TamA family outer membrane protein [Candidatus Margulisiibacteriota bacterium]